MNTHKKIWITSRTYSFYRISFEKGQSNENKQFSGRGFFCLILSLMKSSIVGLFKVEPPIFVEGVFTNATSTWPSCQEASVCSQTALIISYSVLGISFGFRFISIISWLCN